MPGPVCHDIVLATVVTVLHCDDLHILANCAGQTSALVHMLLSSKFTAESWIKYFCCTHSIFSKEKIEKGNYKQFFNRHSALKRFPREWFFLLSHRWIYLGRSNAVRHCARLAHARRHIQPRAHADCKSGFKRQDHYLPAGERARR